MKQTCASLSPGSEEPAWTNFRVIQNYIWVSQMDGRLTT